MRARGVLSLLNLAAMTATFVVWLAFPRFAEYALYLAVGWILIAAALLYVSGAGRAMRATAVATGGSGMAGTARLPSGGEPVSGPAAPIGFCIYCATDLPVGAEQCPTCGHRVRIR